MKKQAFNPYLPTYEYIPDGEPRVFGERLYVYGSHDRAGGGDWIQFDPGVLVDDDGRVYLYSGFNPFFPFKQNRTYVGAYVMELKSDMVTMAGEPKIIIPRHDDALKGHDFFEASSIRKIKNTYYFVYSSQQCHELCYATSKYPDRDFAYGGTIISNMDLYYDGNAELLNHGGNNHGGMICIHGEWYIFYHRPTNQTMYSRQGSAEPIKIEKDGSIRQAEMTSCGLNGGPLDGMGTYEAGIVCNLFSVTSPRVCTPENFMELMHEESALPYLTQDGDDREEAPGTYIAQMGDGACAGFKYFAMGEASEIAVVTRGNGCGKLSVYTSRNGEPVAELTIVAGKDWHKSVAPLTVAGGNYPLYFVYRGNDEIQLREFTLQ